MPQLGCTNLDSASPASELIGENDPANDWKLSTQLHAERLPKSAGTLRRVLLSKSLERLSTAYAQADAIANTAQRRYKRFSLISIGLRFTAILCGVLVIVPSEIRAQLAPLSLDSNRWLVAVQFLLLAIALAVTDAINRRRLYRRWMLYRAKAEGKRYAIFRFVLAAKENAKDGECPLLPLKLEYIRRYFLGVQSHYYSVRGLKHKQKALQTRRAVAVLQIVGILSLLPVLWVVADALGAVPLDTQHINSGFLAVGSIVAAVLTVLNAVSRANLDARNAAQYTAMARNLAFVENTTLASLRRAAELGEESAPKRLFQATLSLVEHEHAEWKLIREELQRQATHSFRPAKSARPGGGT
jgi:hypothetical protein